MISFDELSGKSKSQIRSNEELSKAFTFYFNEKFNRKPSFCCSFEDYAKLFNLTKNNTMSTSEKYNVTYPPNFVLAYRKDNKTYRTTVKRATDDFFKEFLKNYADAHFPNADKKIVLKEQPKKETPVKENLTDTVETPKKKKTTKKKKDE